MSGDPVDPKHHHYGSRIRRSNQNENLNQEQKKSKISSQKSKIQKLFYVWVEKCFGVTPPYRWLPQYTGEYEPRLYNVESRICEPQNTENEVEVRIYLLCTLMWRND